MVYPTHKNLDVWKRSLDLVDMIYQITNEFPQAELYGLTNQIRRCAVSIPSNIAEGAGRQTPREYLRFVAIARGSASELETQLIIAHRQDYLNNEAFDGLTTQLEDVSKMLTKFYQHYNGK